MVENVLERLTNDPRFQDKVEHLEELEAQEAQYTPVDDLPPNIEDYLRREKIKLYQHQAQAIQSVREGENILITTPTASGKTLAFNLPVLEKLSLDPQATALYIYPAKALSNDQLRVLRGLEKACDLELDPAIYDGDTPRDIRPDIRRHSRVGITNPYQLHLILAWHHQWERFYSQLKFVVIDEAHQYRGVFGSNVAFLIRRLRRICNYYGSNPQFILSSATLANPEEFSQKLVGQSFQLIDQDSSPRGRKHFLFYNPHLTPGASTHQETTHLFLFFIRQGLQTLCFTLSRRMAELIARWSLQELQDTDPELAGQVTAYRAGYLAPERRKIEYGLKTGALLGVTTTNALELGIDIGSLDAVIISGYPGTMISTWQQAGRSGRKNNDSLVVLVAFEGPLDQYFMKNPQVFFDRHHENAIIDLENVHITFNHLLCAMSELPLSREEITSCFQTSPGFMGRLIRSHQVRESQDRFTYQGKGSPAFQVGLHHISRDEFQVYHDGYLLETLDRPHAYLEAHHGAVLINKGETYLVEEFNLQKQEVRVRKRNLDYHTQVLKEVDVRVLEWIHHKQIGQFRVHYGEVEVTEHYHRYKRISQGKTVATHPLDLPPLHFRTKGLWFTLPGDVEDQINHYISGQEVYEGGLHGTEHALIAMFPLKVLCDRFDIGGLSTPHHPDTRGATIFIYDAFQGGIGLAEKAVELMEELVELTYDMVRGCQCRDGCPSCIYSPKCGNDNQPLHKRSTQYILSRILKLMGKVDEADIHLEGATAHNGSE
ncbi:MAG TPA: DEAD/DEAH box helicase [Methanobacteriaceae archaeon]|nr:DEAD/DEAH box helicase [Methanobacteriaceae archaeon]